MFYNDVLIIQGWSFFVTHVNEWKWLQSKWAVLGTDTTSQSIGLFIEVCAVMVFYKFLDSVLFDINAFYYHRFFMSIAIHFDLFI